MLQIMTHKTSPTSVPYTVGNKVLFVEGKGGSRNWERGGGGGAKVRVWQGWGKSGGVAAPGRVREGGTPPAQLGGLGERCKLPQRGPRLRPRSQRFLRCNPPKVYVKTAPKTL